MQTAAAEAAHPVGVGVFEEDVDGACELEVH
jgi:hypothetical protein